MYLCFGFSHRASSGYAPCMWPAGLTRVIWIPAGRFWAFQATNSCDCTTLAWRGNEETQQMSYPTPRMDVGWYVGIFLCKLWNGLEYCLILETNWIPHSMPHLHQDSWPMISHESSSASRYGLSYIPCWMWLGGHKFYQAVIPIYTHS